MLDLCNSHVIVFRTIVQLRNLGLPVLSIMPNDLLQTWELLTHASTEDLLEKLGPPNSHQFICPPDAAPAVVLYWEINDLLVVASRETSEWRKVESLWN